LLGEEEEEEEEVVGVVVLHTGWDFSVQRARNENE